jgi:formate/nitrite transporter FocA (FNT family)
VKDLLIRGFLSGAFLGIATSLAFTVRAQPLAPIAAAIIFPVGFVLLVLLGLELATGNFALLPMGVAARRVSMGRLLRNWSWVYVGNLAGCLFYALCFYWAVTSFGHTNGGPVATQLKAAAVARTVAYQQLGATGWGLAVLKAVLANWMVTVAVMMAFVARSTIRQPHRHDLLRPGLRALDRQHVRGAGRHAAEGPVSMGQWWVWNQIPVTIGNIIGGAALTGLALYATFGETAKAS